MTSDASGPGRPPEPEPQGAASGGWPAELVPPPAAVEPGAPGTDAVAPAPGQPPSSPGGTSSGTWGAPPAATPPPGPAADTSPGTWSTTPSAGTWGGSAAAPAPDPDATQPLVPPVPQSSPGLGQPATGQVPPPPASPQPGGWGPPPPAQPGGWQAGPAAPGTPGGWAPAPAASGNGCLKACLVVGVVLVVLGIIGVILLGAFASRFADDMGLNPDGSFDQCELISPADVKAILGPDAEALPMGGLVDGTIGQILDNRVLPDAPDCWVISDDSSQLTGRIARQDGNAAASFAAARQLAQDGGWFAGEVAAGDDGFCTGMSDTGSFGALVRTGDRLAYVALIDAAAMQNQEFEVGEDGTITSPETCGVAARLAEASLR